MTNSGDQKQAATEAAQHVVDDVTSYEYSGEKGTIADALDEGLRNAGVEVGTAERERLLEEIHDVRNDESGGTPAVDEATPKR